MFLLQTRVLLPSLKAALKALPHPLCALPQKRVFMGRLLKKLLQSMQRLGATRWKQRWSGELAWMQTDLQGLPPEPSGAGIPDC